jgi:hypothetical protein
MRFLPHLLAAAGKQLWEQPRQEEELNQKVFYSLHSPLESGFKTEITYIYVTLTRKIVSACIDYMPLFEIAHQSTHSLVGTCLSGFGDRTSGRLLECLLLEHYYTDCFRKIFEPTRKISDGRIKSLLRKRCPTNAKSRFSLRF